MKICKIIGDLTSSTEQEKYTSLTLCDDCVQADFKRGEDAQVVCLEQCETGKEVSCEVCYKTFATEKEELVYS